MVACPKFDIAATITAAKLGRTRRDAQEDTCAVFAAALYDALVVRGVSCRMVTAAKAGCLCTDWYHAVVEVDGLYYDSMGEFSEAIWRIRARVHPKVKITISYKVDTREECYEEELHELHAFYLKALNKAFDATICAAA